MDSKVIKSHQYSLERSYAVFTEINSEFRSKSNPFKKKKEQWRSLYLVALCLATFNQITTSLPHIFYRNSWLTDIFKSKHQTGL